MKRSTAFKNFNRIKDDNNIMFEKQFINYNGIKPVKYKIHVVKNIEEGDVNRTIRDDYGRLMEEMPIFGVWTVLNDAKFKIEEDFWVYGFNPSTERKNIQEIIQIMMDGITGPKTTKQVIVIKNKLLFYNEDKFDMVICKCMKDAQRLHHALNNAATGIKNFYFMGTATSKKILGDYYEIIHEHTGWDYTKIWRTTTRP